ncbi:glycosyltransferase [Paenibacillus sp. Marseille-P2973]|uniref:glycosyltransferase family 2 protein n=1 Tax=Paenibacillus TaxID=44249 RepID=UPI001B35FDEF|nr:MULTISPECIES: glycosyltransferase [Paenibacillus]MBQ4900657.1 glycosyltransferase [Paenibacillus sp. Marseille-P2973]MDN4067898.1 glycosyltransferase [Paenibacillus vini]
MDKRRRFRARQTRPARRRTRRDQATFRSSPEPVVSVIIPVMNEHRTLGRVIREATKVHPKTEIIVVANGCTDRSAQLARKLGAIVLEYKEPLGHDVPRAVGARQAKGEVLLFLDGDMVIPAKDLRPFTAAILSGSDLALNDYEGPVQTREVHPVVSAKHTLNTLLNRSDLKGASLTAVPHALSRQAASRIGYEKLEKPPLAQTAAILEGLKIRPVHSVDVGRLNRPRLRSKHGDLLTGLVLGDHLEAAGLAMKQRGPRGGFSDLGRLRERAR